MAGACGKLKCCLLYELDTYIEAGNEFPRELLNLELSNGIAKPFKTDYLKKEIWYSLEGNIGNTFNLSLKEVKNIIQKNKRGIRPEVDTFQNKAAESENQEKKVTLEGDLDRFDKNKQRGKNIKNRRSGNNNRNNNQNRNSRNRKPKFKAKKQAE